MQYLQTTRKALLATAGVVAGIYLALAFVALFCATMHVGHHGHEGGHSSLCGWACQANNSVSLVSLAPPILPILVFVVLLDLLLTARLSSTRVLHSPRGPPRK